MPSFSMSTSDGFSKTDLNIQISSPKGRLLSRLSSISSNNSPLHSKGIPLSSNNNNWWEWRDSNLSGVACMVISSISYSFMGLFVKLLSGLKRMRHPLLGSPEVRQLVLARAFVGYIALSTYFYSIQELPLRDATVLNFTMPIFTAILAALMLNEKWGQREAAGTFFSFLGVILVSQPQLMFSGRATVDPTNNIAVGIVAALLGSSLGALSYIIVRSIGRQGEPALVCVFVFAALSAPFSAVAMFFQGLKVPTLVEAAGLVMVGLTAFAAQIFLTRGLQLEKAAKASSLQHLKVICTYLLGVAFLGETPSLVSFLGALLVAGSAIVITHSKN